MLNIVGYFCCGFDAEDVFTALSVMRDASKVGLICGKVIENRYEVPDHFFVTAKKVKGDRVRSSDFRDFHECLLEYFRVLI